MKTEYADGCILVDQNGPLLRVTLNRPAKMNALSQEMFAAIHEISQAISADSRVRALVVTGHGRAFCAGGDLGRVIENRENAGEAAFRKRFGWLQSIFDDFAKLPIPTIAAINGYALGAGLQLAIACDFRIAAAGAQLGLPDVKNGIIPGLNATTRLPRLIGVAQAKALLMTADSISAKRALAIGLVHEVVSPEDLYAAADQLGRKLLKRAPLALAAAKHLLDSQADLSEVAEIQYKLMGTNDAREGISAFFEKRPPSFSGD